MSSSAALSRRRLVVDERADRRRRWLAAEAATGRSSTTSPLSSEPAVVEPEPVPEPRRVVSCRRALRNRVAGRSRCAVCAGRPEPLTEAAPVRLRASQSSRALVERTPVSRSYRPSSPRPIRASPPSCSASRRDAASTEVAVRTTVRAHRGVAAPSSGQPSSSGPDDCARLRTNAVDEPRSRRGRRASTTRQPRWAADVRRAACFMSASEHVVVASTNRRSKLDARPESSEAIARTPKICCATSTIADAGIEHRCTAGASEAVSEPTPQLVAATAPEMPMEVTPELRQQEEPVADDCPGGGMSETPVHDAPEPASRRGVACRRRRRRSRQAVVVPSRPHADQTGAWCQCLSRHRKTPRSCTRCVSPRHAARRRSTSSRRSKPMIRIDGEIGPLESEPTLTAADVDRLVMELAPPRRRDALQNGPVEWLCDVPEIGRVRCMTFRDHRGPGVLFRMFPPRAISADQLGLTPEVQALCQQSDGLVLVTGARASGKSTLLNAFVDLINRTRSDHVITIESQIGFVHESRRSFISQRESRGDCRAGRDLRARGAARGSRRHDDRGSEVGRARVGGARGGRVRAAGAGLGARVVDDRRRSSA